MCILLILYTYMSVHHRTSVCISCHKAIMVMARRACCIGLEIRRVFASSTRTETREEHLNECLLRLACNIFSNNDLNSN